MKINGDSDIFFLGKVMLLFKSAWQRLKSIKLFSRIKKRQMELAGYEGENSSENAKMSYAFGMLRIISVTLLCVLLCLTLIFGGGIFSYENVYYMFKDIEYVHSFGESRPEQLNYSRPIARQDVTEFKNGLAVASDSEIKLFTSTGRVTLTRGSEYSNPKLLASDSSILIYDQGNRSFAIYNSFTELHREKLDFPIGCADMAANGWYAVVTRSQKYNSSIRIYNNRNKLEMEYFKNDYVVSISLSSDAKFMAVTSLDVSGGSSRTTVTVVDIKKGEVRSELKLADTMPYVCDFISDSRIAVICSDHAAVYDKDLSAKGRYDYASRLVRYTTDAGGFALVFEDGGIASNNMIAVFDTSGGVTFTGYAPGDVSDVRLVGEYAFVLTKDYAFRFDTRFGGRAQSRFESDGARLAVFDGGEVAICTGAAAYYISFE